LDLYEQGGVTYIKIALDEMLTISNIVVATLQGFFEAFAKVGIAKVPKRMSVLLRSRSLPSPKDWPKYLRSQVKKVIFLKGSLGALLLFSGRLLHICW